MERGQYSQYEFSLFAGTLNSYFFTTEDDVVYEIKFVPSTDFLQVDEVVEADIFEMIISVIDRPTGTRLPADPRVATTIFAIFEHFFLPHRQAIVFICDSSDRREEARFRKFGQWFYQRTHAVGMTDLAKFDLPLFDGESTIYLSMLISIRHPQMKHVVDLFLGLTNHGK